MDSDNIKNIIKYLIKTTPYGHLKETIENLKNLVGTNMMDNPDIQNELIAYEEDHLRHVNLNDDKLIISKFNKDSEKYYHDQSKNIRIAINPLSENIEKIDQTSNNDSNSLQSTLNRLLNEYRNKRYKSTISAANAFFTPVDQGFKIHLLLSAHNFNYKNFWTGEWLSFWELETIDANNITLKGTIKINTYYYEDGNIQFNLKTDFNEKLQNDGNVELFAQDVIKIQLDLDEVYDNFSDNYIKPLRRKLPVTGQKMNWSLNQIGAFNK